MYLPRHRESHGLHSEHSWTIETASSTSRAFSPGCGCSGKKGNDGGFQGMHMMLHTQSTPHTAHHTLTHTYTLTPDLQKSTKSCWNSDAKSNFHGSMFLPTGNLTSACVSASYSISTFLSLYENLLKNSPKFM